MTAGDHRGSRNRRTVFTRLSRGVHRCPRAHIEHALDMDAAPDSQALDITGAPKGTRTPVFAVKGRRPRPLDDGRDQPFRLGRRRRPDVRRDIKSFAGSGKQPRCPAICVADSGHAPPPVQGRPFAAPASVAKGVSAGIVRAASVNQASSGPQTLVLDRRAVSRGRPRREL